MNWKDHIPGIIGGIVLTGSGIAIAALGFDLPIYATVSLSAVLGVAGVLVAAGKSLRGLAGWIYVIVVAARSGQAVEHLPQGLTAEESQEPPEVKPEEPKQ